MASKASGPSTPAPDQVPASEQLQSDDGIDRGLPDHALSPVLAHVSWLSTT